MNLASAASPPEQIPCGERILVKLAPEHAGELYTAALESIEHVHPFLAWCHPGYQRAESIGFLETVDLDWQAGSSFTFGIFDGPRLVGGCGISRIDDHPVGNLGYWVRHGALGRGIATSATSALAAWGFKHLKLHRIEIIMATHNHASSGVARGVGATYEGELRNRLYLHGAACNAWCYSLTPADLSTG